MSDHDSTTTRFPMLFTGASKAMVAIGLRSASSFVDVNPQTVTIRMGWAFRATLPRSSVTSAAHDHDRVLGWGAHGWGGRWLNNGSSFNIVRIEFEPRGRGRTAGFPVNVGIVRVSVDEPDALIAALS